MGRLNDGRGLAAVSTGTGTATATAATAAAALGASGDLKALESRLDSLESARVKLLKLRGAGLGAGSVPMSTSVAALEAKDNEIVELESRLREAERGGGGLEMELR